MSKPAYRPSRREILLTGLALPVPVHAAPAGKPVVVTMLGDSITAGYGLPAKAALPVQLQAELRKLGVNAVVRNAGVSGDTTAGGLGRVDFSVQPDTTVCVVELGANDFLQGYEPAVTRRHLDQIVKRLKARGITVVLAGGRVPARGYGPYGRQFEAVFPEVAKANRVLLAPDLLADVSERPELKQPDGIHPNAEGVKLVARRLAPVVVEALRQARRAA